MSVDKAGSCTSLQCVSHVRSQDGPSLSVGEQLRGFSQLQVLHAIPGVRPALLYVHRCNFPSILHTILEGER